MAHDSQTNLLDAAAAGELQTPQADPADSQLPATTQQPEALITISDAERLKVFEIQTIVNECELSLADSRDDFSRGLILAKGMRMLRAAFTKEIMADVMQLYNSPLGFMADRPNSKNNTPYSEDEVRDAVIQAHLKGGRLVGNEFTIISRKAYLNKEHYERKVREIPGLSDLELNPGAPVLSGGSAWVPFVASWVMTVDGPTAGTVMQRLYRLDRVKQKIDGEERDNRVVVRVNDGGGADMAIGKATRKILAKIYRQMTGSKISGNVDPSEIIDADPGEAIVQESPDEDFKGEADNAQDAAGEPQTSQWKEAMEEYGLELDQAMDRENLSIPMAARAFAKVKENNLPDELRAKAKQMHDDAVASIRTTKAKK